MEQILQKANKSQSSDEVKHRALYGYYFLGLSKTQLSKKYHHSICTISNWITHYENTAERPQRIQESFDMPKRQWLLNFYHETPIHYIDEAKMQVQEHFNITISTSDICQILRENNVTWKTLEKRAIQIKDMDIVQFMTELNVIDWDYSSLVFLDEVSFDIQGLLRTNDYGVFGDQLKYRGELTRKPQKSMLVFLGQNGILDTFVTDGTFSRLKFFEYCKYFALGGTCQTYPGRNSVWIFDDAKIHCHPSIIRYLKSLGIMPIFLPAYTPFFNPLEYIFGVVRKHLAQKSIGSENNMELLVNEEFTKMRDFSCTKIFKKCGYIVSGRFNSNVAYEQLEDDFEVAEN